MNNRKNRENGGFLSDARAITLALAALFLVWPAVGASAAGAVCDGTPQDHPAVGAFLESPAVADAIADRTSGDDIPGCIAVVEIGGSCGVVGCSTEYLVGRTYRSPGVNPQTTRVFAVTEIRVPGGTPSPAKPVKFVSE